MAAGFFLAGDFLAAVFFVVAGFLAAGFAVFLPTLVVPAVFEALFSCCFLRAALFLLITPFFSAVSIAGCLQDVDLVYKLVTNFYASYPKEAKLYFPVDGVSYRELVIGVLAAAWLASVVNAVYWKKVT